MIAILPSSCLEHHTGEMANEPLRRPGDDILDRYCPNLSAEEREAAHGRLRAFAAVVARIHKRAAAEAMHTSDSTHPGAEGRIPSLPPPV
jgi:hypothetical protein